MTVEVLNTGSVIDGVSARVIGLPKECVTAEPALLPLFPDASGSLTLELTVPPNQTAGRHEITIEVTSHGAKTPPAFVDLVLAVEAHPSFRLGARPRVVEGRRSGRSELEFVNEGNVPLDVTLSAADVDRSTSCRFTPERLRLEPGATASALLTIQGPRMLTGAEVDRPVTVLATAQRLDLTGDAIHDEEARLEQGTEVRLRQRPLISRGMQTAIILACIIALWAGVFLLGLSRVFAADPLAKQAPASFFLAADADGFGPRVAAQAEALPKTGQLPPGVGAEITGRVVAASSREPVGRILVQAVRMSPSGPKIVSSAATQADGTYRLAGLFPMTYYLQFSARGYRTVWYPNAAALTGARPIQAAAQGTTSGVSVIITGLPASVSGTVDLGETRTPIPTTVTARRLTGADGGTTVGRTTTNPSGQYVLNNLPAPGTYEFTFTAPGYQATSVIDTVGGGDARLQPVVTLGTANGQISGTVRNGRTALGGATVTTTVRGKPVSVLTPTTGLVGRYVLLDLPTPATYVVTFTAPGHGTQTIIIDLAAGQSRANLDATLASGTGSVSGRLVDVNGTGLGGAKITVGGAASNAAGEPPGTTTLTSGEIGGFAINGLIAPGSYTLTATLPGFAPATVPFALTANGAPARVTITLATRLGAIRGEVSGCADAGCPGATVTVTNGAKVWTAVVSSPGGALPNGGYLVNGLEQGTYTVTVTREGMRQQTALVTVTVGATAVQNLVLGG